MKTRESGMSEEPQWAAFFNVPEVLDRLGLNSSVGHVVEFGCGYGTFTIPTAQRVSGSVYALDIEPDMVRIVCEKATAAGLNNVQGIVRDFLAERAAQCRGRLRHALEHPALRAARDPTA
jgi:cyclopropane fatty-acyl-phospholipid synthase-like methyltransferase